MNYSLEVPLHQNFPKTKRGHRSLATLDGSPNILEATTTNHLLGWDTIRKIKKQQKNKKKNDNKQVTTFVLTTSRVRYAM